ncbi:class I SAM-dependent methyltransferase [Pelagibius sp.]|uniref:class I SAM-dependent methyltransferase n=1 Tax=Pelagibius sp. TaxID=1931238 RepID=UPI002613A380|nr:class I SAM-dependent methyltransferase [Pelagibius sp.]
MSSIPVLKILMREAMTRVQTPRVPEPDLVMDDPDKVAAFSNAGRVDGVMAPVYLYHCAQVCEVAKPGDLVVDLGCGPASQLALIAQLNPDCEFLGVDFSDEMLNRAREHVVAQGLSNVRFQKADMTQLDFLADASVDALFSTCAFHHLHDRDAFNRTFAETARVLRPEGGLYLVDFGRPKSEETIRCFAYQHADREPELFTLDYLYSLKAAFTADDFKEATETYLERRARVFTTFLVPFLVAAKSPPRNAVSPAVWERLNEMRHQLPKHQQVDLKDLVSWFSMGGLKSQVFG